jgi:hypothetical protein
MSPKVGIEIQSTPDADPTMLIMFFERTNDLNVKRSRIVARGETELVQVILMFVGQWALEKYLLDPFADKLDEWTDAITSLEGKQFRISINFQEGRLASIGTVRISNPWIVGNLWKIIKSASDLLASHVGQIPLDRILIVPDKLDRPLVIGYQGARPTHLLDLSAARLLPIQAHGDTSIEEIEQLTGY